MSKKYDTLVFICRVQPPHMAHLEIIRRAAANARQLIVVVGSAKQPRTYKNPFTDDEREAMLYAAGLRNLAPCVARVEFVRDSMYNDQVWVTRVQEAVAKHTKPGDRIGIIGHEKDETTFYLKMFPQWESEVVPLIEPLNATDIRELYFRENANLRYLKSVVPAEVYDFLVEFAKTEAYTQVIAERKFIETYKSQFAGLPYPPVFVTADAVVICSGHVLMIKRRSEPGKGLWALPGGFLNANSDRSMMDAAIRELKEETGIKVPAPVLRGSIQGSRVFDAINRSARGRTITHAFKIELPDGELPKVKGQDDAEKAKWIPIAQIRSEDCFEDHHEIISWAVGA